jgi:hypothetical protein
LILNLDLVGSGAHLLGPHRLLLIGLSLSRVSLQALLTNASGLGDHIAMAFLLLDDASLASLLALKEVGSTFGRLIKLDLLAGTAHAHFPSQVRSFNACPSKG